MRAHWCPARGHSPAASRCCASLLPAAAFPPPVPMPSQIVRWCCHFGRALFPAGHRPVVRGACTVRQAQTRSCERTSVTDQHDHTRTNVQWSCTEVYRRNPSTCMPGLRSERLHAPVLTSGPCRTPLTCSPGHAISSCAPLLCAHALGWPLVVHTRGLPCAPLLPCSWLLEAQPHQ